jgi:hypothetical protein
MKKNNPNNVEPIANCIILATDEIGSMEPNSNVSADNTNGISE